VYFFYYFPIGLDIKVTRRATITYFLSVFLVICFLFFKYNPFSRWWNFYAMIFDPSRPSIATAITHAYLHGGWIHIGVNILYLIVFGRVVEDRYGPFRFFLIFTLSSIAGAYTHLFLTSIFSPHDLQSGVIGASGATSGLLGAFVLRFYYSRIKIAYWVFFPLQAINKAGRVYVPSVLAVLLWFLLQSVRSVMQFGISGIHVAYSVHVGSFLAGVLLAAAFGAVKDAGAEKHLVHARNYFEKAEWFAAQGEYLNYIDKNPDDIDVYPEAARAFLCTGDRNSARRIYSLAIKKYLQAKLRDKAETTFIEAMKNISDFVLPEKMHLDLAYGMERTLKFGSAVTAYRRFLEMYPWSEDAPFIHLRMANIMERRFNKPGEALSFYKRLVSFYPDDSWVDFAKSEMMRLGEAAG